MQHQLSSGTLKISIGSLGAEITSIVGAEGLEYIWQADKAVWPRHAPVLFPIVGRLKDNTYTFNDTGYSLSQHGFARDLEFELVEKSETHCRFELKATAATRQAFPFDFIFRIGYRLEGAVLNCSYEVINPATIHPGAPLGSAQGPVKGSALYFSVGAHPGFNCPLLSGESFEDYYLEFDKPHLYYTLLDNGLRTDAKEALALNGNRLYLSASLFDRDALVFENGQVEQISLCSRRSVHKITMDCKGWPYFGIWAKKGTERFVCLEPWYGVADHVLSKGTLVQKDGILRLEDGQEFNRSFSVTIA